MDVTLKFSVACVLFLSVFAVSSAHHHLEHQGWECGGNITNATYGNLTSPNYPNDYPNNASCLWLVVAPEGQSLYVRMSFDIDQTEAWCADHLVAYGGEHEGFIAYACGQGYLHVITTGNYLVIKFESDDEHTSRGFHLQYYAMPQITFNKDAESTSASPTECVGEYFGESGEISSPNYPEKYDNDIFCVYNITVPEGGLVYLNFTDFELEPSEGCMYDFVRIYDANRHQELAMVCGEMALSVEGISNSLQVVFATDKSNRYKGWSLTWSSRACAETLEKPTGYLTSPGYPIAYPNGYRCLKTIMVPEGRVGIFLNVLFVEPEQHCGYDYLKVSDSSSGKELGKYCDTGEKYVSGISSSVDVLFKTDSSVQGQGWSLNWTTVPCGDELTGKEGRLDSPPKSAKSFVCSWKIDVGRDSVALELFETDNSWSCEDNSLAFYDGENGALIVKLCETDQRKFVAYSSSVFVVFVSHGGKSVEWSLKWMQQSLPTTLPPTSPSTDPTYLDCGDNMVAAEGSLFSPEYPTQYPNNAFCMWNISVPNPNDTIYIDVTWLNLEYHSDCLYDSLEFVDEESEVTIAKLCGNTARIVKGFSNSVLIVFRSDHNIAASGWELHWKDSRADVAGRSTTQTPFCGDHFEEQSGLLVSPNYPKNYPDSIRCVWTIEVPANLMIDVKVTDFHVEYEHTSCIYDSLQFHDGITGQKLGIYCGVYDVAPFSVHSFSNVLRITFDTDGTVQFRGWSLYWKAREISKPVEGAPAP